MTLVEHVMMTTPVVVEETATVLEAAQRLQQLGLRHLPVVADNRLVGIISDRDLRGPMVGTAGTVPSTTTSVSAIMTRHVVTVHPTDSLGAAAKRLVEHRVGALLVVDQGGVLRGILSYVDILARLGVEAEHDARAISLLDRD